jgi:hypothetical protein
MKVRAVIFLNRLQNLTARKVLNSPDIGYIWKIRMNLLGALFRSKGHNNCACTTESESAGGLFFRGKNIY